MIDFSNAKCLRYLALAMLLGQAACTTPVATPTVRMVQTAQSKPLDPNWIAIVGPEQALTFSGEIRHGGAGQAYGMSYPAVDLVSFLAVVAAHSAIESSRGSQARSQQQIEADKVLETYQLAASQLTTTSALIPAIKANAPGAEVVESAPTGEPDRARVQVAAQFTMLQDQRALYLDMIGQQAGTDNGFKHAVRVVSDPLIQTDPQAIKDHWLANNGQAFRETTASMLDQAVALLIADIEGRLDRRSAKQLTVRYPLGGTRSAERASVIKQTCERQTVRTLRQWVLSVPREPSLVSGDGCASS